MSHYFSKENDQLKSQEKLVHVIINDNKFKFYTDNGVFSKSGLDFGSRLLIESTINTEASTILDLGCGYGPIGIIFGFFYPKAKIDMVDINERAVILSKKNAQLNYIKNVNVFSSDGFDEIKEKYDLIITNPPIRAGKKVIYDFFEKAIKYLTKNGELIFVINKKHGALSAIDKCRTIYQQVDIVNKKSGYMIIRCKSN